ncbi:hypothetical protein MIB92_10305 [Aestuariirhabdus sp. Z084]|uniref:hypothetical protein n=1 Tax=Aestuariirhabdus haliotis TaxID=2918751 RepID=UPI00201B3DA8|nr:hypothetical protein [Aestuariirhabdus haliotis]MCL6416045.1 hypothetical protein [Aestuariirhabdus haliotis]MCL6419387.1 hypothetical protein [Aestuariirhabdus haliotis]
MESRIPLPTDNIYKFYALFGLLLAVFSAGAVIYVNQSTNNLVYDVSVEYQLLKHIPETVRTISEEARLQVLESKINIANNNKWFYLTSLGAILAIGILMIWYGFKVWHTVIQPLQDEITRLNIKKLKQEVGEEEAT